MKIHDDLPSGFALANALQVHEHRTTGGVTGAGKLCFIKNGPVGEFLVDDDLVDLGVRLHPPHNWDQIISPVVRRSGIALRRGVSGTDWYVAEYNNGWAAGGRGNSAAWDSGRTNAAWDDGYLDRAAGRPKWHLTYCTNHDACGEA